MTIFARWAELPDFLSTDVDNDLTECSSIKMVESCGKVGELVTGIDNRRDTRLIDRTYEPFQSLSAAGPNPMDCDVLEHQGHRGRLDGAIVVGASAGARSAVELALRHPDKVSALILIVPAMYSPESPVAVEEGPGNTMVLRLVNAGADFAWWAAERIAPSVLIRFLGVEPELINAVSQEERDQVMSVVKSVNPLSLRFAGINLDGADFQRPPLEQISAPTLVITARDDLFNTLPAAQFAAGTIPNAELVVYDTGGHLLVGRQNDTSEAIGIFLTKTMGRDAARAFQ